MISNISSVYNQKSFQSFLDRLDVIICQELKSNDFSIEASYVIHYASLFKHQFRFYSKNNSNVYEVIDNYFSYLFPNFSGVGYIYDIETHRLAEIHVFSFRECDKSFLFGQ